MAVSEGLALLAVAGATGLAGSGHCSAMCGGIASAVAVGTCVGDPSPRWAALALAHAARVAGYASAGAAAAVLARGASVQLPPGLEPATRLVLALCMAVLAARMLSGRDVLGLERLGSRAFRWLAPAWRRMLRAPPRVRPLALGLVWGFLPCGLVYSMLPVAAASADPALAAGMMAVFGAGTTPALLGLGFVGSRLSARAVPSRLRLVSGTFVLLCAIWTASGAVMGHGHTLAGHALGAPLAHDAPARWIDR